MTTELMDALLVLEKEKNISKDVMLHAIEESLLQACKKHFGKSDNVVINMNYETGEYELYAEKEVVEEVEDSVLQISLPHAKLIDKRAVFGSTVRVPIQSREFGRIATQNAKSVILQKIREEENRVVYDYYYRLEKDVITGTVARYVEPKNNMNSDKPAGLNVCMNLGRAEAMLTSNEQVPGEKYPIGRKLKVYVQSVKETTKGCKILVSRSHPDLVKRLFESEVTEIKDGIVEIKAISREAGSRTKMAVWSNDSNVDAVGACVGMNSSRVNAVVAELNGEKIDIISWDENAALLIEHALSPSKVICVAADEDEKSALVVVPDTQLSLAIGKAGQNARLAAKLTGYKIDIKSESQAIAEGLFDDIDLPDEYEEDGEYLEDGGLEYYEE
ncbi:MAG: transcription termination/antitermination protein NusA [Lachnospiraceae bacterium]|nr:transcription termination/antitermination protein NusA [Lachnospiraceae bacterium]